MYYALLGEEAQAMAQLAKAIDLGYDDVEWLQTDDSLDSIRGTKTFRKLMESLEGR